MAIDSIVILDSAETERMRLGELIVSYAGADVKVFMVAHGQQAVELVNEHLPDVVMLNLYLNEMSGFQVIRKITKNLMTSHIPIFAYSTNMLETDRIWAMKMGASVCVSQPIEESVLRASLAQFS